MTPEPLPLIVPVELAGALLGVQRQTAYRMAREGSLPTLPGPGRMKVPVAALENLCGRRLTPDDIEAAKARLEPGRAAFLSYQANYRAERARIAAKASSRSGGRPASKASLRVQTPAV